MRVQRALIVDDEADIRELLEITLNRMKLDTQAAASVKHAKALLHERRFDLCLTDLRLPDGDSIELVSYIQAHHASTPVAVITAYGSMETAIRALKAGAFDFVSKPIELAMLRDLVNSALKLSQPGGAKAAAREDPLLGTSPAMAHLKATMSKLARSQAPVYLLGESGAGKELVARQIHDLGPRAERPFVPVNCGAIPTELMESEFFGHLKGSFTGAVADKQGLFQAANGGSLFLDEVAELPLHMQVKLLRAIQERAVKPIGAQQEASVDVRILSATHKNLSDQIALGRFRQDLYYRINVIELRVPPLRERLPDLPLLAEHILKRFATQGRAPILRLSAQALEKLEAYRFPGNVRELENILERAATLCEGQSIQARDLRLPESETQPGAPPTAVSAMAAPSHLEDYLEDKEKTAIMSALEKTRWNRTAAARLLGISFRQLRYRLKKLNLD
ncbi:MAG: sigma-54-dependent Fis family transcriptional regulator [Gammaproteobacteria bacterium]|nr:sigma-54-dependent Fis family transcriptional regulator [Gammaproteobacteria bacterium]